MDETGHRSRQPTFLIVVGGDASAPVRLPAADTLGGTTVIAADSGTDRLVAAGLPVHHVVGDLDSAAPDSVQRAAADGADIHRHLADKDATDLELALDLVRALAADGPVDLLVVGSGGGRLDHQLADLLALSAPLLDEWRVRARFGVADVAVARPGVSAELHGPAHEQVSLLPLHGPVRGIDTTGLRWPLVAADLVPGTTRAMSNELLGGPATVRVAQGTLVVIRPGTVAPPIDDRPTPYDPTPTLPTDERTTP